MGPCQQLCDMVAWQALCALPSMLPCTQLASSHNQAAHHVTLSGAHCRLPFLQAGKYHAWLHTPSWNMARKPVTSWPPVPQAHMQASCSRCNADNRVSPLLLTGHHMHSCIAEAEAVPQAQALTCCSALASSGLLEKLETPSTSFRKR
jgi:hypothetical protein